MTAILEARQLWKTYSSGRGVSLDAVAEVSLEVARGSFVLLNGHSGSGKTTLLAMLGGLERPSRGQVSFAGRDLAVCSGAELSRLRRRMGFIFQDFALIPGLPVWENVTYPLIPRGVTAAARRRVAETWLDRVGLADRMASRARELSGGEQQRVAVARALAGRPEVILADEPTSNLDDVAALVVATQLDWARSQGVTVVVSSHAPRLAGLPTCRYEMRAGRLLPLSAGAEGL